METELHDKMMKVVKERALMQIARLERTYKPYVALRIRKTQAAIHGLLGEAGLYPEEVRAISRMLSEDAHDLDEILGPFPSVMLEDTTGVDPRFRV